MVRLARDTLSVLQDLLPEPTEALAALKFTNCSRVVWAHLAPSLQSQYLSLAALVLDAASFIAGRPVVIRAVTASAVSQDSLRGLASVWRAFPSSILGS